MSKMNLAFSFVVVSLLFSIVGQGTSCHSKEGNMNNPPGQLGERLAAGTWGGQNAHMEVSEGGAQVRFSCARGQIEGPITLDAEGRFSAKGTFQAESMGPTYEDNPPRSQPAVYSGVVLDDKMTLTVAITGDKGNSGTYNLNRGEAGHVKRCH